MALSRRHLPALCCFAISVACVALSSLLTVSVPEDGRAINPFIMLAVYALPVVAVLLVANGLYRLSLLHRNLPPRNLSDAIVLRVLLRWRRQDDAMRPAPETREEG
jgi:hypothetical protein